MSSDSDSDIILTPENISNDPANVAQQLFSQKSRTKYLNEYNKFVEWQNGKGAKSFSEAVFLAYFQELAKIRKPPTLWSIYSMLKATVNANNDIKIESYTKLVPYLKRLSEGYRAKKSHVLSRQNVETFLNEAPDNDFLATKVALIFGIHGACRGMELTNLTVDDIEKQSEQLLLVKLKDTKTKVDRSFIVRDEYKSVVDKYMALRPPDTNIRRFFIRYQGGRCWKQAIGKNKISEMPRQIAKFLKLPQANMFTGHCFRRTSVTLADSGVDLTMLKHHGGGKSSSVVEGYIENETNTNYSCIVENIKIEPTEFPIVSLSPSRCEPTIDESTSQSEPTINEPASRCEPTIGESTSQSEPTINESASRCEPTINESTSRCEPRTRENTNIKQEFEFTNAQSIHKTTISVPNKTVNIYFTNCQNVSHININV